MDTNYRPSSRLWTNFKSKVRVERRSWAHQLDRVNLCGATGSFVIAPPSGRGGRANKEKYNVYLRLGILRNLSPRARGTNRAMPHSNPRSWQTPKGDRIAFVSDRNG